jgi:excisionase family DNA binding protein
MLSSSAKKVPLTAGMLTVPEVAQLLHLHPNTVRNWSNSGFLKSYQLGHRHDRRFSLKDVNKLLKSKLVQ